MGDDLRLFGTARDPVEREDGAGTQQDRGNEGGEQAGPGEQPRDPFQIRVSGARKCRIEPQVGHVQHEGGHEHRRHPARTGNARSGIDDLPRRRGERSRRREQAENPEHLKAAKQCRGPSRRSGAYDDERSGRRRNRHRGHPRRPAEHEHSVERDQHEKQEVENQGDSHRHGRAAFRAVNRDSERSARELHRMIGDQAG